LKYSMFMDEKALFTRILGIKLPWFVNQVIMDEAAQRIDIYRETFFIGKILLNLRSSNLKNKRHNKCT